MNFIVRYLVVLTLFLSAAVTQAASSPFSSTIRDNVISHMLANIATSSNDFPQANKSTEGAKTIVGAVIASSYSESNPSPGNNYMYTWARDTAITMNEVFYLLKEAVDNKNQADINKYGQYMLNYVSWLNVIDANASFYPGIARCFINGVADTSWMQPQNDGPALRSIVLINFANLLLDQTVEINGKVYGQQYVESNLYKATLNQYEWGIIKYNIQYVYENVNNNCYGLWESCNAVHFFTQMAQLKGLVLAAGFACRMNDSGAGEAYLQTALKLYPNFKKYYKMYQYNQNNQGNCYFEGLNAPENVFPTSPATNESNFNNYRGLGLDISALFGVLYGRITSEQQTFLEQYLPANQQANLNDILNGMPQVSSDEVKSTVGLLIQSFMPSGGMDPYGLNANMPEGVAVLGRYPGDLYSGGTWNNPDTPANAWFISTMGLAQYYYLTNQVSLGNQVMNLGVLPHMDENNTMSEQFNRNTGKQCSFQNLSWSYAMYLFTCRVYNAVSAQAGSSN